MIDAALVIEGGAMRGVYTSGVLDVFMENNIFFAYIVAASSGALNAANYVAKHKGRSARINLLHSKDRRYFGIRQLIRSRGNYFNFDYLYHKPVNELYPYNYKALEETEQKFIITATNCITAEPIYFIRHQYDRMTEALTASSSIPLVSKIVIVDGVPCLDGAISAPIGIHKAIEDGNKKIVVILTRDYDFMKKDIPAYIKVLMRIVYRKYSALIKKLIDMPKNYNILIEEIKELESRGEIFVIRPQKPLNLRSTDKDSRRLLTGYIQGIDETNALLPDLIAYLNS